MLIENEIKYLKSLIVDIENKFQKLSIPYAPGKVIMGVIGTSDVSDYYSSKTVVDTVLSLDKKIKLSLDKAIEYAYSEVVLNNFNPILEGGEEEFLAYYYIENAIYRTSTIWDCIAQLYNIYHNLGKDQNRIHYHGLFKELSSKPETERIDGVEKIFNYLDEVDDTTLVGRWNGNHGYIKQYRNKMIHRNAPDGLSMSNFDMNMKSPPVYILKRLIEDYFQSMLFFEKIALAALNRDN